MLVLTRKRGEAILIADDVKITVVRVNGDKVRIGIQAPDNVKILRAELAQEGSGDGDVSDQVSGSEAAHRSAQATT